MTAYYADNVGGSDGNPGTSTGSAKQTLAAAAALISAAGDILHIKNNVGNPYILTSAVTLPAGVKGDIASGRIRIEGYTTTPGARDGRPTITCATNNTHLITLNDNDFWEFVHLKFTHTAGTRGLALNGVTSTSTPVWVIDCVCDGCLRLTAGASMNTLTLEGTEVCNCTSTGAAIIAAALHVLGCDIHDNAGDGIGMINGTTTIINIQDTILDSNAGIGISIIASATVVTVTLHGVTIVDNGGSGLKLVANSSVNILDLSNNIFYGNGGYGIENLDDQAACDASKRIDRANAFGGNTSGARTGISAGYGEISLLGDPFVNRAARDFSINNTFGAILRGVAFPSGFPGGTTLSYRDIGAVQHQDAGGGGFTPVFRRSGGTNMRM